LLAALGLGNPGHKYTGTRHNIGKETITWLAEKMSLTLSPGTGEFLYAQDSSRGLVLTVPTCYVNTSGIAALQVVSHFGIEPEDLLVVCDDFSLPLGTLRIRKKGSDGGHNGLASIIFQLESEDFPRLRMGIGPLPGDVDPAGFVLSGFQQDEEDTVEKMRETAGRALLAVLTDGIEKAMSQYNKRPDA
jgi:PTH1 family peptidyl-tRNA hydrolase